jgi:glyoxylase I family protein
MERVQGIGGAFFRAEDPMALARWYAEHLGIDNQLEGETLWWQAQRSTVFPPFPADTGMWPADKQWMVNFWVRDLDAMTAQLRAAEITVEGEETEAGVGRFAHITDPEGNRIQLWEPLPEVLGSAPTDGWAHRPLRPSALAGRGRERLLACLADGPARP